MAPCDSNSFHNRGLSHLGNHWLCTGKYSARRTRFVIGTCGKEPTCKSRRHRRRGFSLWVEKIPWRRACNPLQCPCLENPMDREAWGPQSTGSHRLGYNKETACARAGPSWRRGCNTVLRNVMLTWGARPHSDGQGVSNLPVLTHLSPYLATFQRENPLEGALACTPAGRIWVLQI